MSVSFIFRDNEQVDIVAANLYQKQIERLHKNKWTFDKSLPRCRQLPKTANLTPQHVDNIKSILVCSGVYQPDIHESEIEHELANVVIHSHRDFTMSAELMTPTYLTDNVKTAMDYILNSENIS